MITRDNAYVPVISNILGVGCTTLPKLFQAPDLFQKCSLGRKFIYKTEFPSLYHRVIKRYAYKTFILLILLFSLFLKFWNFSLPKTIYNL